MLPESVEDVFMHFVGEDYISGNFVKFNSNGGQTKMLEAASDVAQAFSHYNYASSHGQMMVLDVQGVCQSSSNGHQLVLSDPQVLSVSQSFGPGDLGMAGMVCFFATHICNDLCRNLDLTCALRRRVSFGSICLSCLEREPLWRELPLSALGQHVERRTVNRGC